MQSQACGDSYGGRIENRATDGTTPEGPTLHEPFPGRTKCCRNGIGRGAAFRVRTSRHDVLAGLHLDVELNLTVHVPFRAATLQKASELAGKFSEHASASTQDV